MPAIQFNGNKQKLALSTENAVTGGVFSTSVAKFSSA